MCGIAGIVGREIEANGLPLREVMDDMANRGPDDVGWLSSIGGEIHRGRELVVPEHSEALLLHRRLSILDLSEAGWQPMGSPDGRYYIAFNGLVYNYLEIKEQLAAEGCEFRSNTDTEVILAAYAKWGSLSFKRFVGMFAFAILDVYRRRVVLARDPFGIKPLFLGRRERKVAFGSQIGAVRRLLRVGTRVNPQRLYDYLRFGMTDHGEETLFDGVDQLLPGHYAEVSLDTGVLGRAKPYNTEGGAPSATGLSFNDAAARLRETFLRNLELHLRSDVPVGAALSGGIDSSAIVAGMRHLKPDLDIHAISFIPAGSGAVSEERWIDCVTAATNTHVHKVTPAAEQMQYDLDEMIRVHEQPVGSASVYAQYRVFQRAKEIGITVMLDGQGADELFAGYPYLIGARLAGLVRKGHVGHAWRLASNVSTSRRQRAQLWMHALSALAPPRLEMLLRASAGKPCYPEWLNQSWFAERGVEPRPPRSSHGPHYLRTSLRIAQNGTLPRLLRFEDRNSMAWSIESRVPFLSTELRELSNQLPDGYLISGDGTTKSIFRAAMEGIVPDEILQRREKIGFTAPQGHWLAGSASWLRNKVTAQTVGEIPALNAELLLPILSRQTPGAGNESTILWRTINILRWAEICNVSLA